MGKKATKFYHSSCQWAWIGYPQFGTHPCVAVMLGDYGEGGKWYLYTADAATMASDQNFCCESTWNNKNGMNLGTVNRKFIDEMIYLGDADFHGDYFDGRSRRYIMAMPFDKNMSCPER